MPADHMLRLLLRLFLQENILIKNKKPHIKDHLMQGSHLGG